MYYFAIAIIFAIVLIWWSGGLEYFSPRKTVYLYWGSYCGHCVNLKASIWPEFKRRTNAQIIEIQTDSANLTDADRALIARVPNMPGVPYIVMFDGAAVNTFNAPRTVENLLLWSK
jgi:hypothetical protein